MNPADAEKEIRKRIVVTPQKVVIAKALILSAAKSTTQIEAMLAEVLNANQVAMATPVVLHPSVDSMTQIIATAGALSWNLAARQAVWSLIHNGMLCPLTMDLEGEPLSVGWTTVVPGGGGESSGWKFQETLLPVPRRVRRAPSLDPSEEQFLSEPDLYLHSLGVTNMHRDVGQAFIEAVKCFRAELFGAAFAMLGKASEGAWLELGESLINRANSSQAARFAKQQATLEDHNAGPMRKVEAAITIYAHDDVFRDVYVVSGVRPQSLKEISVWSDAVRDSRNTIHFGVDAAIPNTYEKLAALLIGAVPYVRILYQVKAAADAAPP